jgi:hypothetical protein
MYGKGAKIIIKKLIKIYAIVGSKLAKKDLKNETSLFKLLAIK